MAESEIVVSTEALEELQHSIKRFRGFLLDHLREVNAEMRRLRENLEESRRYAAQHVRACQADVEAADEDDDLGQLEEDLESAQEDLHRIERNQRRIDELAAVYDREAAGLLKMAENQLSGSVNFLQQRGDAMKVLLGIRGGDVATGFIGAAIQMLGDVTGACIQAGTEVVGSVFSSVEEAIDLSSAPLPSGFRWLKLGEINLNEALSEVNSAADFRPHASYDTLRAGLETLKDKVLPLIASQGYVADSFFFQRQDSKNRVDYENGAQRVFDAFFGSDPIALELDPATGKFIVINGRHRIKVAQDVRWLAVPVKIIRNKTS